MIDKARCGYTSNFRSTGVHMLELWMGQYWREMVLDRYLRIDHCDDRSGLIGLHIDAFHIDVPCID